MDLEISYYRDALKSYMTIRCPEEAREADYRFRMAASNPIEGILPCSLRRIDGEIYLYYEVSARQKLSHMFADRILDTADLSRILSSLAQAGTRLSGYLLDAADLLLDPDMVYYDFSENRYYFTYYPGLSERVKPSENRALFAFLAEKTDSSDREAAGAAYQLDALSEMPGFVFTEKILRDLFGERIQVPEESFENPEAGEADREDDWSESFLSKEKEGEPLLPAWETPLPAADPPGGEKKGRGTGKPGLLPILVPAAFFAAAAAFAAAGQLLPLPVRTLRLFTAGALAAGAAGIPLVLRALIRRVPFRRKKEADREPLPEMTRLPADEFDFWKQEEKDDKGPAETVFVSAAAAQSEKRLYGNGKAKGMVTDLDALPHTIGTAAGFADVLLDDSSVSRMHARISQGPDQTPVLTDLNSTNGTWVNGIRLQPEESIRIGKGDVIRFGETEFCCR